MSREIKFRAWDKERNKMHDVADISWDGHGGCDVRLACYDWNYANNVILMQYTGLRDKNGKEIYEGDIIQETQVGEVIWNGDARVTITPKGLVGFREAAFDLIKIVEGKVEYLKDVILPKTETRGEHFWKRKGEVGGLYMSCYDGVYYWPDPNVSIEVIGNIHENPELLEGV